MEQELLTLPEHLSSPPVFSGVRVARSLVLCACFVDHCLSFCTFSFGHCVVCSSSIYGFWLPLWYLQTLLANNAVFVLFNIWLAARVLVISIVHRRQLLIWATPLLRSTVIKDYATLSSDRTILEVMSRWILM